MTTSQKSRSGRATRSKPLEFDLEFDLDRIRVADLIPSPQNDKIYKPVDPKDPEIQKLAESIRKTGLHNELIVTRDLRIVSGHRRRVALMLAGVEEVLCKVLPFNHDHPDLEQLLVVQNLQRVKTIDEQVREQVVLAADAGDSYNALLEHRLRLERRACGDSEAEDSNGTAVVELGEKKRRPKISSAKDPLLQAVRKILADQRQFWPLSNRTIHYCLLNDPPLLHASKPGSRYKNNPASYKNLNNFLTRARFEGHIPFEALHDPTRTSTQWKLFPGIGPFVGNELETMFMGYRRDYQQSQPNYIEIVGEKNTVTSSIHPIAAKYHIRYTLGRGYASIDPLRKMAERFRLSGRDRFVILIMSDFDPEGEDIAKVLSRTMRDDFGVANVLPVKVCLTREQVAMYKLPPQCEAKKASSRAKGFMAKHGEIAYELEALSPTERMRLLDETVQKYLDIDAFNREVEAEKKEAITLQGIARAVRPYIVQALDATA